ncbi:Zn-ribbon domain-containing OB-fold protein [Saccharopolyspora phatthalungensis]|uniref:Putative OB-fold protein n=1 Tax=Saccharopolyspora phatthalungensis TaxID=664693 RepID=A0A840Q9Z9_9PSEU|nr:Zn-ribbon domain-containing OB-fold protein [Saccharopolyspora phatthalungensis]MBB5157256.1 putative OB-fold protein [Saccharopolyspora phatthalungensis]
MMHDVSFRPDVFHPDPPTLLGSRCPMCAGKVFPPRDVCPRCGEANEEHPVELSRQGTVYSYTVVRQAPPGLTTPYVLACVDLPDDEVRVLSRIEGGDPAAVAIGLPVRLGARPVEGSDGGHLMFVFNPVEEAN